MGFSTSSRARARRAQRARHHVLQAPNDDIVVTCFVDATRASIEGERSSTVDDFIDCRQAPRLSSSR